MEKRSLSSLIIGVLLAVFIVSSTRAEDNKSQADQQTPAAGNKVPATSTTPSADEEEDEDDAPPAKSSPTPTESPSAKSEPTPVEAPPDKSPPTPVQSPPPAAPLTGTVKKAEPPKQKGPQYVYITEADGWQAVSHWNAMAQSFRSPGTKVKALSVRPAVINNNVPQGPLTVEVRDMKLSKIYLEGVIAPSVLRREFYWQPVQLTYVAPMKAGEAYLLIFRSGTTKGNRAWILNTIYKDTYPYGTHYGLQGPDGEDVFFSMSFEDGSLLYIGPRDNNTAKKIPVNSGISEIGVNEYVQQPMEVSGLGKLPKGEYATKRSATAKK